MVVFLDEILADHVVAGVEAAIEFLQFAKAKVEDILDNEVVL